MMKSFTLIVSTAFISTTGCFNPCDYEGDPESIVYLTESPPLYTTVGLEPDPELTFVSMEAAQAWSTAPWVAEGDATIKVELARTEADIELLDKHGEHVRGFGGIGVDPQSYMATGRILIRENYGREDMLPLLIHEIGHALGFGHDRYRYPTNIMSVGGTRCDAPARVYLEDLAQRVERRVQ